MTTTPGTILLVGGDSFIGKKMLAALRRQGYEVIATTRRKENVYADCLYLDLLNTGAFAIPRGIDKAVLLAAAADYEACESSPEAKRVNVVGVPSLVSRLLKQGVFTLFTSSVTVFGGDRDFPNEEETPSPTIAYARQKAEGEKAMTNSAHSLGATALLAIVRITKVLGTTTRPLPAWYAAWRQGEVVQPFTDLHCSPMTLDYTVQGLVTVLEAAKPGIFHLSGAEDIDYAELCRRLAGKLGVADALIQPCTAQEAGVNLFFKPRKCALGMRQTKELLALHPQPIEDTVQCLATELCT